MPTTIGVLTPTGLFDADYTADSLREAAKFERQGVYTIASTFNRNRTLLLDAHLDRMEESARLEGISLQLDRHALRMALRALIDRSGYENSRFRITAPRDDPTRLILSLEPFAGVPPAVKTDGVYVATAAITRHNPRSKTNEWMARRETALKTLPPAAYEGIIVDDHQHLLEGFGSNFYAIQSDVLYTADESCVLNGISRKIALQMIRDILPLKLLPISARDIPTLNEAFLTSSSRGVIPIVQIDTYTIGTGRPGPLTQQIAKHYDAWVEAHLEPI